MTEAEALAQEWLDEWKQPEGERDLISVLRPDCRKNPELAWAAILHIVEHELTGRQAERLAAGPLEVLLAAHGPTFIARVEERAASDPRFNHLLGGVWQNDMAEEIWGRVEAARNDVW